jgi:hypothetical protein
MSQLERTGTWHALGSITVEPGLQPDYDSFGELHKRFRFKSFHPTGNLHFASHLARHLPEVAAQHMDESDWGILNLEVGALKQATRDAIARPDWHTVRRHLACVEDLYEKKPVPTCATHLAFPTWETCCMAKFRSITRRRVPCCQDLLP